MALGSERAPLKKLTAPDEGGRHSGAGLEGVGGRRQRAQAADVLCGSGSGDCSLSSQPFGEC